ncbi:MAG: tRNA (adenosine(37)-N6)-threonylcarbamoyltransferase complex dimerization subunit type 1 TsaB [Phenylobacterium sp.]|uniref:tRNA (adenosine(37)-N6)-threonylcarbamoyltransferase complex dimerization subunit type 1 TsaB n=4 Tax=Phenylobacterium sp. TaxID=1871053 RepID=UPI0025FA223B|nr:tRNA (adenosine(37)-N6)-threonylcarbamoyltransferase complex dimerization subunit type 1 TsaB [Phenylobacterium sp.]MCA6230708.1 tRNA (adenosine(37)-N6)-threonylcarbamoyltransferase complex dimerization subunit type 1 TsaB [Phenylobacterium sp.]MCA6250376.1 tRNA (adenosine(37)-N6)-threonylcarbamoyltransferase complex dimerization subunit type 1 TsaB [Phenylobacterium sp.]MCA6253257.1 tRNA (adenosine(37)-N6)-threonylcarbamoyltransferase complex dimerization subunit type 1 TsaB [Phenylobacteriu
MRVLAIDTCLAACSVAVLDGERTAAWASEPMERGHQERLAPLAREVMARSGLAFTDLDRIAVTLGPGSFTGLRVGLAFAKGLGLALERPVIGLGCLEVLAAPFAAAPGRTLALLPGRGEAVCSQVFEGGTAHGAPVLGHVADLDALAPVARIVGTPDLAREALPGAVRAPAATPDAAVAGRLAAGRRPEPLVPLYMRPPDARLPGGRAPP